MRLTDPDYSVAGIPLANRIDSFLRETLASILRHADIPQKSWDQARLAARNGGLGLIHAPNTHSVAYVASVLECEQSIETLTQLSTRHRGAIARRIGERVSELYNDEVKFQFPPMQWNGKVICQLPLFDDVRTPSRHKQEQLQKIISEHESATFHMSATISASARVRSASMEGAAFVHAIPKSRGLQFPTPLYTASICAHLGLPIPFIRPAQCTCKKAIDVFGYHLSSQCNFGNQRMRTHNAVIGVLVEMCRQAGFLCKTESGALLQQVDDATKRRTDLTIYNWRRLQSLEVDVTVTDVRTLIDASRRTPIKLQEAANKREHAKKLKYNNQVVAAGGIFLGACIEKLGVFGDGLKSLTKELIEHAQTRTGTNLSLLTTYWNQRIVLAMRISDIFGLQERVLQAGKANIDNVLEEADQDGLLDFHYVCTRTH